MKSEKPDASCPFGADDVDWNIQSRHRFLKQESQNMEITGMLGKLGLYGQNKVEEGRDKPQEAAKTETGDGDDQVRLSSEAQVLHSTLSQAEEASEVREDKVKALKEEVANGTYKPDSQETARRLLEEDFDLFS
jgi:negative regulator of flagellin synthesis FlgM